jgi:hypothetical protein
MITALSKLIASIAALITSLALAWVAYNGVVIQHGGLLQLMHHTDSLYIAHDGNISHY